MSRPGILTLTTDFGFEGPYVAAMKGVVLGLAPEARLVDVSHSISPQNILEGAFILSAIAESFPAGTVHLAVIDPGVGTERRVIAARAVGLDQWFVLPDNGLLSGVLRNRPLEAAWEIGEFALRRPTVSPTFHGRDILAPAACHLLLRRSPDELGPRVNSVVKLRNFEPRDEDDSLLTGEVIFRDAFGNLVTNIGGDRLRSARDECWIVEIAGEKIEGLATTYADKAAGSLLALVGSSGWLEIAVSNGDAGRLLAAGPGTSVWIKRKPSDAPRLER